MDTVVRVVAGCVVVVLVVGIGVGGYIYLSPPPKVRPALGPFCDYVHQNLSLECPRILGDQKFFAIGDAVPPPTTTPLDDPDLAARPPVDAPISQLLSPTCLVKGSQLPVQGTSRSSVTLPEITYGVEKSWTGKAAFEIPELNGLKVDPGGNAGKISSVTLKFGAAQSDLLDQNAIVQALGSCEIKKACTDSLRLSGSRIISRVVVADGVQYQFMDSDNKAISVDAALQEGSVILSTSQGASSSGRQGGNLYSSTPLVVAVGFLDPQVLQQHTLCQETVVVQATGNSTVTVSGGGGSGNIGAPQSVSAGLGEQAQLERTGSEASECSSGFERTISNGRATGIVRSPSPSSFTFDYSVSAQGGHYATAAGCLGGNVIGKTGHDNSTLASVRMAGTLRATVRSDYAKLVLAWDDLPPGSQLRVIDPDGNLVQLDKPETKDQGPLLSQVNGYFVLTPKGSSSFHTEQAGVYSVDIAVETSESAAGAGRESQSFQGHLTLQY